MVMILFWGTTMNCTWCGKSLKHYDPNYINGKPFHARCAELYLEAKALPKKPEAPKKSWWRWLLGKIFQ